MCVEQDLSIDKEICTLLQRSSLRMFDGKILMGSAWERETETERERAFSDASIWGRTFFRAYWSPWGGASLELPCSRRHAAAIQDDRQPTNNQRKSRPICSTAVYHTDLATEEVHKKHSSRGGARSWSETYGWIVPHNKSQVTTRLPWLLPKTVQGLQNKQN
jgi:hypothetical protein